MRNPGQSFGPVGIERGQFGGHRIETAVDESQFGRTVFTERRGGLAPGDPIDRTRQARERPVDHTADRQRRRQSQRERDAEPVDPVAIGLPRETFGVEQHPVRLILHLEADPETVDAVDSTCQAGLVTEQFHQFCFHQDSEFGIGPSRDAILVVGRTNADVLGSAERAEQFEPLLALGIGQAGTGHIDHRGDLPGEALGPGLHFGSPKDLQPGKQAGHDHQCDQHEGPPEERQPHCADQSGTNT